MDPMMPIPLPYNLKHDELILDSAAYDTTTDEAMDMMVDISWVDDVMERIMRGAVILFNRTDNTATFGECLHTAIIWEVG